MENRTNSFVLTAVYLCMLTVSAAKPEKFLSIDCGAASNNTDERGIDWVTDDNYIETGTRGELEVDDDRSTELHTFRYFTRSRSRNCYVLPVENVTTYLLRVRLFPGDDSSDESPSISLPLDFNVTFNNNHWFSYSAIDDSDRNEVTYESVFHSFQRNEVDLCLWRGTNGTPFINSIELRALPFGSYIHSKAYDKPQFMVLGDRINTGTAANDTSILRYPDDDYDRIWWPAVRSRFPSFTTVEASASVTYTSYVKSQAGDGYNWPPNKTLADAWVGRNLSFRVSKERVERASIYAGFYFKEIRPNLTDAAMEANPLIVSVSSGEISSIILNLTSLIEMTVSLTFENEDDIIDFAVISDSSKDAILNGFEYYYLDVVDTSRTYSTDQTTLTELQKSFNLKGWTGDPCYPVAWEWLTCDPSTSRINTLMLANMNISGSIPESIASLVELTEMTDLCLLYNLRNCS